MVGADTHDDARIVDFWLDRRQQFWHPRRGWLAFTGSFLDRAGNRDVGRRRVSSVPDRRASHIVQDRRIRVGAWRGLCRRQQPSLRCLWTSQRADAPVNLNPWRRRPKPGSRIPCRQNRNISSSRHSACLRYGTQRHNRGHRRDWPCRARVPRRRVS